MDETRIIDANINRAAEGLRVLEDIARFRFDNRTVSSQIRDIRHKIRDIFKGRENELLLSRDSASDVGARTSQASTSDGRKDLKDTTLSNFKRVQEAFRSLEEILKTKSEYQAAKTIEELRFVLYSVEPVMLRLFKKPLPSGVYGILAEKFSLGRTNIDVARQMVDAGIDILQYREKLTSKSLKEIYSECIEIRKITKDANVPFIVNDYADIALMVGADGLHTGQDDLPLKDLRKIAKDLIIGLSTHSPNQAKKAMEDGADYIGVGPVFSTRTKEDVCDPVGLEYLEYAVNNVDMPFVAIGGIKLHNLDQVLLKGAKSVCLVTEIVGSENIEKTIKQIKKLQGDY